MGIPPILVYLEARTGNISRRSRSTSIQSFKAEHVKRREKWPGVDFWSFAPNPSMYAGNFGLRYVDPQNRLVEAVVPNISANNEVSDLAQRCTVAYLSTPAPIKKS